MTINNRKNRKLLFYEKKAEVYVSDDIGPGMKIILDIINDGGLKILDVGCACGNLGKHLKKRGNFVCGIEISETAAQEAKKVLDDVIVGDVEEVDIPYPENFFDVIIYNNILEHLFDPKAVLKKFKKYLKENGEIIVGLPNIANWQIIKDLIFGKFEYTDSGLLDSGHIRFFTPISVVKLLREAGYLPIETIPSVVNFPLCSKHKLVRTIFLKIFRHLIIYHYIVIARAER